LKDPHVIVPPHTSVTIMSVFPNLTLRSSARRGTVLASVVIASAAWCSVVVVVVVVVARR
jgi:hypothetical protein